MDKTTHEVRRLCWKNIIEQCQNRPKGMSARQWMVNNSINEKSYYYWLRRLRKEAYEQMQATSDLPDVAKTGQVTFAEIPISVPNISDGPLSVNQPTAVIKTSTLTIAFSNEISDRLLSRIIKEVSHA